MWGPVRVAGRSQFPLYHRLGVGIYEITLPWASVAPTQPAHPRDAKDAAYRWPREISDAIGEARRYQMRVLLQVIGAPRWANGGHPWNWAPRRPADYADFVTAAAHRYRDVRLWMIWGEPSRQPNFQPLTPAPPGAGLTRRQASAPHLYARILDAAYGALKRISRREVVIGGNTYTTGDISTRQWIDNLRLPNGRPPRLDLYGHNPFSSREPDLHNPPAGLDAMDFSDLGRLANMIDRKLARSRRQRIGLFLSEWTIPTAADGEFNFYVDPPVQARWIRSAFRIVARWPRIYGLGWIHITDDPPTTYGGLLDRDYHPKPGFFAFERG